MLDREMTELKIRHTPFSVYMKWHEGTDIGREVLFIEGQLDDKLLVSPGNVLPTVKLDPYGDLAKIAGGKAEEDDTAGEIIDKESSAIVTIPLGFLVLIVVSLLTKRRAALPAA